MKNAIRSQRLLVWTRTLGCLLLMFLGAVDQAYSQWTSSGNDIYNTNTGNVGIGTSSPVNPFQVVRDWNAGASTNIMASFDSYDDQSRFILRRANGNIGSATQVLNGQNLGGLQFRGWTSAGSFATHSSASITALAAENFTGTGAGALMQFTTTPIGSTSPSVRMTIDSSGFIGIGTTTPGFKLHLQGGQINSSGGFCIDSDCKTAWSQLSPWSIGGGGSINYASGFVGIGTSTPSTKLDVVGTVDADAFSVNGTAVVSSQWATNGATINYATGNVGIATASPTEKLHVTGNVKVSGTVEGGNIIAKYQDVAEWVESSQELTPGTVVVLDSTKSNQVIAATQSYDSRVAGVISLQPGIALGEQGEGKVLVATTGRVNVKVDATNGPIQIGDLLVTSEREGFAMKSLPLDIGGVRIHRPGTLIGKALEPLAKGTDEILVLLSMQ